MTVVRAAARALSQTDVELSRFAGGWGGRYGDLTCRGPTAEACAGVPRGAMVDGGQLGSGRQRARGPRCGDGERGERGEGGPWRRRWVDGGAASAGGGDRRCGRWASSAVWVGHGLGRHPNPANDRHLKTGQRGRRRRDVDLGGGLRARRRDGERLECRETRTGDRLGRLGWSLRRIEEATGVRRETASGYLRVLSAALSD